LYYNDLGHKAYDRNELDAAERYHLTAIRLLPDHPQLLDNLGMVYLQQFNDKKQPAWLASAKEYFQRAIQANPHSIDPHVHMENVLVNSLTGNLERDRSVNQEIVRLDTQLLEIDPFIPFARKNLANAYYNLGDFEQAFLELKKAIEYEPNYVPGYLLMAEWYRERGDEVAGQIYTATGMNIVNKYRNFKPTEAYEVVLLGRPEQSWVALNGQKR
jgi:tetratricopeptide (TPR) repeat protein